MQRIESGNVGVSPTDVKALLNLYGVTDPDEVNRLTAEARASRRQRYETPSEHREYLTPGLRDLMQYEGKAVAIRSYQPTSIPGPLQTPATAEAIIEYWANALSEKARQVRLSVRMARRAQIFDRPEGPEFFLILDESVIKRQVGGLATAAEQLENLADLAASAKLHLRLVPLDRGGYVPAFGAFQLVSMENGNDDGLLYREAYLEDEILHDPTQIKTHRPCSTSSGITPCRRRPR